MPLSSPLHYLPYVSFNLPTPFGKRVLPLSPFYRSGNWGLAKPWPKPRLWGSRSRSWTRPPLQVPAPFQTQRYCYYSLKGGVHTLNCCTSPVVLNGVGEGYLDPPGDIWQGLQTFLLAASGTKTLEVRDDAKHTSYNAQDSPGETRILQPKQSMVLRGERRHAHSPPPLTKDTPIPSPSLNPWWIWDNQVFYRIHP